MVWCAFDLDIALGAHGQIEAGVAAQRGQHVVVERDTGVDVDDSGAIEVEFDDDVGFFGGALNACAATGGHDAPKGWANSVAARSALAARNASFSVGQSDRRAQVSGDADVADQDPGVEVTLPGGRRVGEPAEQHEVGVAGNDLKTHAAQRRCHPLPFGDQRRDAAERVVGVP